MLTINDTYNSASIITSISLETINVSEKILSQLGTIATRLPKNNRYKTFATLTYNFSSYTSKFDGNFITNIVYLYTLNYIP